MSAEIIPGAGEDGNDLVESYKATFLTNVRDRQEAVWAVIMHGRLVVDVESDDEDNGGFRRAPLKFVVYLRQRDKAWWEAHYDICWSTLSDAIQGAWGVSALWVTSNLHITWLLDIPEELVDFVAQNIGRPKPRRYNSTAVT